MEEIKFRGKSKTKNHLVYGSLITNINNQCYIALLDSIYTIQDHPEAINNRIIEVVPETIGQFTGLKDKNGEEIYKDDYMRDKQGNLFKVIYAVDLGCWLGDYGMSDFQFDKYKANECVKVGNLYENEELSLMENEMF